MVSFKLVLKFALGVPGFILLVLGVQALLVAGGCQGAFICVPNVFGWVPGAITTVAGLVLLVLALKV